MNTLSYKSPEQSERSRPTQSRPVQRLHKRPALEHVQQNAGNMAFKGLLHPGGIQGKYTVGKRDDPHEREADRIAEQIMESRTGPDLGQVRIHTDPAAAASARSLNALAYTIGSDIFFAAGQYDPVSASGRRLLAHELAHVMQQQSGGGLSANVIRRETPPGDLETGTSEVPAGDAAPADAAPDSFEDPAIATPPPEHNERIARLEAMADQIDKQTKAREELQSQYRCLPPYSDEETEIQRRGLRSRLTRIETALERHLENRIALIDEAVQGLEAVLPGFTPAPPAGPTTSDPGDGGATPYTVQSELYRLAAEKRENEAQLLVIKTCLARKRIKQLKAQIAALPLASSEKREALELELQEKIDYLNLSCVKSPSQTVHPTKVSKEALSKIMIGEHFVATPYVALEGQKKGSGGCTIGYGHVIRASESACAHGPKPPELDDPKVKKKPLWPCICDNPLWQSISPERGEEILNDDLDVHIKRIKAQVHVDLDQGQFDALVDISAHIGSLPKSLIDTIHKKICTDDEAVRQEYMKTALFIKDRPEMGPVFTKRRQERVWAHKPDDDPGCI